MRLGCGVSAPMESTPPAGESWEHTANFLCVFGAGALRVLCNLFDADEQVSYHAACHTLLALAAERPAALGGGDVLRWAQCAKKQVRCLGFLNLAEGQTTSPAGASSAAAEAEPKAAEKKMAPTRWIVQCFLVSSS